MRTLPEAISAYREKFDVGPPIWEMEEDEALEKIERALKNGEPMDDDDGNVLPDGTFT